MHLPTIANPPVAPSHPGRNQAPHPPAAPPQQATSRILIVDDDESVRRLVTILLERIGYRVSFAADGEDGWAAICHDRFDLVITDHEMPRLKGLDLLRRIRAASVALPVIMISGRIPWHEPDLLPLIAPGTVLPKPFSAGDLLSNIRTFLSPRGFSREVQTGAAARG